MKNKQNTDGSNQTLPLAQKLFLAFAAVMFVCFVVTIIYLHRQNNQLSRQLDQTKQNLEETRENLQDTEMKLASSTDTLKRVQDKLKKTQSELDAATVDTSGSYLRVTSPEEGAEFCLNQQIPIRWKSSGLESVSLRFVGGKPQGYHDIGQYPSDFSSAESNRGKEILWTPYNKQVYKYSGNQRREWPISESFSNTIEITPEPLECESGECGTKESGTFTVVNCRG